MKISHFQILMLIPYLILVILILRHYKDLLPEEIECFEPTQNYYIISDIGTVYLST